MESRSVILAGRTARSVPFHRAESADRDVARHALSVLEADGMRDQLCRNLSSRHAKSGD